MIARTLADMRVLVLLSVMLILGCGNPPDNDATTTVPQTTTTVPVTTTRSASGCPEDNGFVGEGRVTRIDQPTSDTRILGLISWQLEEGCERFGIDFETTEGAPATTPPTVEVEFLESRQILRVWTGVDSTVVTDQLVETPLVDRLYVVRDMSGAMFTDFHLANPALARATVSNSPARLTLELQAGTDPFLAATTVSDNTVVVSPEEGAETGTRVDVEGYARTFEGNVLVIATVGDEVVAETNTTAADWVETWGQFRTSIELPAGGVSLFVGEESPEDGRLTGATVNLTVR